MVTYLLSVHWAGWWRRWHQSSLFTYGAWDRATRLVRQATSQLHWHVGIALVQVMWKILWCPYPSKHPDRAQNMQTEARRNLLGILSPLCKVKSPSLWHYRQRGDWALLQWDKYKWQFKKFYDDNPESITPLMLRAYSAPRLRHKRN